MKKQIKSKKFLIYLILKFIQKQIVKKLKQSCNPQDLFQKEKDLPTYTYLDTPEAERNAEISFDEFVDTINDIQGNKESKEGIRRIFIFSLMILMMILLL